MGMQNAKISEKASNFPEAYKRAKYFYFVYCRLKQKLDIDGLIFYRAISPMMVTTKYENDVINICCGYAQNS